MLHMDENDLKALSEQLMTVRLDIKELCTKMDGIKDLQKKVEEIHDTSKEAMQSTKAAHKRLDELKIIEDIAKNAQQLSEHAHKRLDKVDTVIFWVSTTVIGAVILGIIAFTLKGGFAIK